MTPLPHPPARRNFAEFPYEVVENVVFWAANSDYKESPSSLPALFLTCRTFHKAILGTPARPNHNVLAQICRFRFDTAAPQRRFGALTSQVFAEELKKRCPTLRRVAAGVVYGEHVIGDLWVVLLMLLEDDGKNMEQLDHVGVERWVRDIIFLRTNEQTDSHGWPVETELIQLAAAIFAMVGTRASALAESEQDRQEVIRLLHPFMFGSHRYPVAHLPTTQLGVSSTHRLPPAHTHTFLTMASAPTYAPTSLPFPHFGRHLTLGRPLVSTSATLATYLRDELRNMGYSQEGNMPVTRAQAIAQGWSGAVQEDWVEANRVRREGLGVVVRGGELHGMNGSKRWDMDFWRLVLSHKALEPDPLMDRQLAECWFNTLWQPGLFSGKWVGRYVIPNYTWFTRMLRMHPDPLPLVEPTLTDYELVQYYQPIQLTLREHISTDLTQHVAAGDTTAGDGVQNGWFPDELDLSRAWGGMRETGTELVVRDPREPDPEFMVKKYKTWYPGMELPKPGPPPAFRCASSSPNHSEASEHGVPADVEMLLDEEEEGVPLGSEDNEDEDEDGMDEDEVEIPLCVDIIITGETDYEHGAAWGAGKVYGRVRRNDGLVVFVRVPEKAESGLGRWIFRGYVRAGLTIVGRWRETGTSMDVAGYEGSFALGKVDEAW